MKMTHYLQAEIWWCEDEVCNCHQPVLEEVTPHPTVQRARTIRRIWEGSFHSRPTQDEVAAMQAELVDAADSYGIKLDAHYRGTKRLAEP